VVVARRQIRDADRSLSNLIEVNDLATRRVFAVSEELWRGLPPGPPTAFALDRRGRLWVGRDAGEWGGGVAYFEPGTDTPTLVEGRFDGVFGFVERNDESVLAFGGENHRGHTSAFITRVDGPAPRRIYPESVRRQRDPWRTEETGPVALPIHKVLPTRTGGILVIAYGEVFRTEPTFTTWTRVAKLKIRYPWGQPSALGASQGVVGAVVRDDDGRRIALATAVDGVVLVDGAEVRTLTLGGQR